MPSIYQLRWSSGGIMPLDKDKVLLVLSVSEARHFARCAHSSLVVEGRLSGEVLCTDPVPQTGRVVQVQTELAWEMAAKTLQQHKLHRTPVKLQVYSVNNATSTRKVIGYILMDLRAAQSVNKWHKVLNTRSSGPCPELCLSLSVEEQGKRLGGREDKKSDIEQGTMSEQLYDHSFFTLNPSGGYYSFGSPLPHQQLFILSITLKNAENVSQSSDSTECYYFTYNLFGNDITSELFEAGDFKPEKASIRINSTRERLALYFASLDDLKLCVCRDGKVLGEGYLSLKPLSSQDRLESRIEISESAFASFVEVTVQLTKETPSQCPSFQNGTSQDFIAGQSLSPDHPDSKTGSISEPSSRGSSASVCDSGSMQPVKRNLKQSFEEASDKNYNSRNLSEESVPMYEFPQEQEHKGIAALTNIYSIPDSQESHTPRLSSQPSDSCDSHRKHATISLEQPVTESLPTVTCGPKPPRSELRGTFPTNPTSPPPSVLGQLSSIPSDAAVLSRSSTLHTNAGSVLASADTAHLPHPGPFPVVSKNCGDPVAIHEYQYSIDIHSIHNIQLEEGLQCYLKYNYPYFGSPGSIVVQPPISIVLGAEHHFAASYSAFKFSTNETDLVQQLHLHPLAVEVWASRKPEIDSLVGIANIPLGEVFAEEKHFLSVRNVSHQKCSLKVPVMAPLLFQITCGYIHCTLVLEDHGPVQLSNGKGDTTHPSHSTSTTQQGLPNSSEYLAAMELEVWKLSQEKEFDVKLKAKETEYLHKMGEEWRRREVERQKVFKEKVESYNNLEKQLKDALLSAQHQQKQLITRETEVRHIHEQLTVERENFHSSSDIKLQQCQLMYEGKVSAERARADELLDTIERLKKQVSHLSNKLTSKDVEFDAYRQQVLSKPESKLQAELTMLQMEKSELERKMSAVLKSKQHYKDQWSQALKELAAYRQKEQNAAREVLDRQQQELECIRAKHMQNDEQKSICRQLHEVRDEVSRLQKGTLDSQDAHHSQSTSKDIVNPDVARWIEERDILLQTGVYTHSDLTIQKLDQKIKDKL